MVAVHFNLFQTPPLSVELLCFTHFVWAIDMNDNSSHVFSCVEEILCAVTMILTWQTIKQVKKNPIDLHCSICSFISFHLFGLVIYRSFNQSIKSSNHSKQNINTNC